MNNSFKNLTPASSLKGPSVLYSPFRLTNILAVCAILASCATLAPSPPSPPADLVENSTFIFEGKVVNLAATSVSSVPVSPHTAVVEVRDVLDGPPFFARYAGNMVTVLVADMSRLTPGTRAVFFADGWIIGSGIAVRELGRLEQYNIANLRKQIQVVREQQAMKPIETNLRDAELVIVGKVSAIRDLPTRPPSLSEHDPQWRTATIEVSTVLRGPSGLKTIEIVFPGSTDVAWRHVPKFTVGQEGIWILRMDPDLKAYAVRTRFDFVERDELDRIRKLMQP